MFQVEWNDNPTQS